MPVDLTSYLKWFSVTLLSDCLQCQPCCDEIVRYRTSPSYLDGFCQAKGWTQDGREYPQVLTSPGGSNRDWPHVTCICTCVDGGCRRKTWLFIVVMEIVRLQLPYQAVSVSVSLTAGVSSLTPAATTVSIVATPTATAATTAATAATTATIDTTAAATVATTVGTTTAGNRRGQDTREMMTHIAGN